MGTSVQQHQRRSSSGRRDGDTQGSALPSIRAVLSTLFGLLIVMFLFQLMATGSRERFFTPPSPRSAEHSRSNTSGSHSDMMADPKDLQWGATKRSYRVVTRHVLSRDRPSQLPPLAAVAPPLRGSIAEPPADQRWQPWTTARATATNSLCDVSNISFVPTPPIDHPQQSCRVRFIVADVPHEVYDGEICRMYRELPHGRLWQALGPMGHAYVDYVLAEVLKQHPCRLNVSSSSSNSGSDTAVAAGGRNVVGFIPVASNTIAPFHFANAVNAASARHPELARSGRLFAFMPSIVFPNPFRKSLRHALHVNFVTHEVGMWGRRLRASKKGDRIAHFQRNDNVSHICRRHVVVPKFDWDVARPLPIDKRKFENNYKYSTLMYFTGRIQSVDRIHLYLLQTKTHWKNFTFAYGTSVRRTFSGGIANATFCIDTTGDSLTTTRITNAVLRGCIPLLLCDDCVFPFSKLYRYRIATTFEELVDNILEPPAFPDYPVFSIRLSQYKLLWQDPQKVMEMVHRLFTDRRDLVDRLFDGLARAQEYFLSPFEAGSRLVDAMLDDMLESVRWLNYSAAAGGINYGVNRQCPF